MTHLKRMVTKKMAALAVAVGVALGGGGAAFAYFTSVGAGTGNAATAAASTLTISQVGPGYDSLASTYHQDQCFECAGPLTEFGNEINLAAGSGQLSNVVVAFRSYAGGTSTEPITLTLYSPNGSGGVTGQYGAYSSVTTTPNIPSGNGSTVFDVTFDFSSQDLTITGPVVYGISFTDEPGVTINVALSNSISNLSVGSDVYPGYVFVKGAANALSASGDAGSCATSAANVFVATHINCATPSANYGAYGPATNPENADIPAVEFNVVGGSPVLNVGDPAQSLSFAITNTGASTVYVPSVTAVVSSVTSGVLALPTCVPSWYSISGSPLGIGYVHTGTTFFAPSGMTISLPNLPSTNQNNCEGANGGGHVTLHFSS